MKIKSTKLKINGEIYDTWNVQDFIDAYVGYEKGKFFIEETYDFFKEMACFEVLNTDNIEIIETSHYKPCGELDLYDYIYLKNDVAKKLLNNENLKYFSSYHIKDIDEFKEIINLYQRKEKEYQEEGYEIGFCDFEDLIKCNVIY